MNRQTTQEQLDDLLSQEITDDELRVLLQRLGEIEYAWTPRTTIADVVEATSSDPLAIGRLLAEIRKEDWEARFGLQVDDHEDRIERIEEEQRQTRRLLGIARRENRSKKQMLPTMPTLEVTTEKLEPEEYVESDVPEQLRTVATAIGIGLVILLVLIYAAVSFSSNIHYYPYSQPYRWR